LRHPERVVETYQTLSRHFKPPFRVWDEAALKEVAEVLRVYVMVHRPQQPSEASNFPASLEKIPKAVHATNSMDFRNPDDVASLLLTDNTDSIRWLLYSTIDLFSY
jgi:hypothetical protein